MVRILFTIGWFGYAAYNMYQAHAPDWAVWMFFAVAWCAIDLQVVLNKLDAK